MQPKLKTTVVETDEAETDVTETDAAVEEEAGTEGAAVIVLVAVAANPSLFSLTLLLDSSTSTFQ